MIGGICCFLMDFQSVIFYFQVDISSACHDKTIKAAQKYLAGKEVVASIFDEAMVQVYPDLLGYWAGFKKTFQPPDDPNKRPSKTSFYSQFGLRLQHSSYSPWSVRI